MARGRTLLAALAGSLFLAGPSLAAPAAAPSAHAVRQRAPLVVRQQGEPRPAIWLLSDADTRIYVFGTVHVLHPDLRWRSPALNRIVREAQELVLELTDAQLDQSAGLPAMMQMSKSVPLLQRVTPARREGLSRMMAELGLAEGSLDRIETWAVVLMLGVGQMAQDYMNDGNGAAAARPEGSQVPGVEATLTREFRANGRPISGVETAADQIGAFRGMPLNVQQAMLDETIDAYINGEPSGDPEEADWVNGNLDGIAAEMETLPPELYETLITRRNRNFADWLVRRLDRPGTVLFAIGAGHLAGRVSVQSMIESRGLRVQRIH